MLSLRNHGGFASREAEPWLWRATAKMSEGLSEYDMPFGELTHWTSERAETLNDPLDGSLLKDFWAILQTRSA